MVVDQTTLYEVFIHPKLYLEFHSSNELS